MIGFSFFFSFFFFGDREERSFSVLDSDVLHILIFLRLLFCV